MISKLKKDNETNYLVVSFFALIIICLVKWLRPQTIPFDLFHFWQIKGSMWDWTIIAWPMFAWAVGLTIINCLTRFDPHANAEERFLVGTAMSVFAGVVEEICFRWIRFFAAIVGLKVINYIFFGWLGFGIAEWFYTNVFCEVANFFTAGFLKPYLFSSLGWFVGAAIISSNGKFRNGHAYQGLFGYINSWFGGMFLFYVMFQFGLIAAIFVHFMYDFLIDITLYVMALKDRGVFRFRLSQPRVESKYSYGRD